MRIGETPWELDQRLEYRIHEANMNLTDSQQRDWFIVTLLPHLRIALSQQNIRTQEKTLEIVMRLHETHIQGSNLGVQHILAELQNLCLEL